MENNRFAKIGENVFIGDGVLFKNPERIELGSNVELRPYCQLYVIDNSMDNNKVLDKVAISVGDGVHIKENVNLSTYGGFIRLAKNSNLGHNTIIYGQGGVVIGENTLIGPNCSIISGNHKFESKDILINKQGTNDKGIVIGNDVWVGANVSILDGVTIGDGAVIGAGSVVTKSIEPYGIAYGSPAVVHRHRK